jgi:alpha-1,3-rhamnosyl/mannosyltransferase
MRGLVFDGRYITDRPSGIGVVCAELLRGFALLPDAAGMRVLLRPGTPLPGEARGAAHLDLVEVPYGPHGIRNQLQLPGLLRRLGTDMLHGTDCFNPVLARRVGLLVTVHDLIPLICRRQLARSRKVRLLPLWKAWVRRQCLRARAVIAVSRRTASDLTSLLGVPADSIRVIHNPLRALPAAGPADGFRKRHGLEGARVLSYAGRRDPYKNLLALVRALPAVAASLGEEIRLVVAGDPDPRYTESLREARNLGLADSLLFTGYLEEEELASMYAASDAFVFPSLYEGFGMPPLEAMAAGTPVVASDRGAIPEVLGGAALYVDPTDSGAIAEGIVQVLRDRALADRLRRAGRERAARFTCRRAAREHLELYAEVLR